MKPAVMNATVLILLSKINRLDLLGIFRPLFTTPAVRFEVLEGKDVPLMEFRELSSFFSKNVTVVSPRKVREIGLESGETSALSLCVEKKIPFFVSDDKKARSAAGLMGLKALGTLGLILLNLDEGRVSKEHALQILDLLLNSGLYLSSDVYAKISRIISDHC